MWPLIERSLPASQASAPRPAWLPSEAQASSNASSRSLMIFQAASWCGSRKIAGRAMSKVGPAVAPGATGPPATRSKPAPAPASPSSSGASRDRPPLLGHADQTGVADRQGLGVAGGGKPGRQDVRAQRKVQHFLLDHTDQRGLPGLHPAELGHSQALIQPALERELRIQVLAHQAALGLAGLTQQIDQLFPGLDPWAGTSTCPDPRRLARPRWAPGGLRGLQLDPGSGRMVPRTRVGRSALRAAAPAGEGASAPNASRSAPGGNHPDGRWLALAAPTFRGTVAGIGKPSTK